MDMTCGPWGCVTSGEPLHTFARNRTDTRISRSMRTRAESPGSALRAPCKGAPPAERAPKNEEAEAREDEQRRRACRAGHDGEDDDAVCEAQEVVQHGEDTHAPQHLERAERLAGEAVHDREPQPDRRGDDHAEDDDL